MDNMTHNGLGKRQREALAFIEQVNGWHSYATDVAPVILSLGKRGLVEVSLVTKQFRLRIPLSCDQCQMLSINGIPCHETGCPNIRKRYIDGEWVRVRECFECGCEVFGDNECCTDSE